MNHAIRTTPRLHPLFAAAAVSVIAVSAAGVGVMTGVLPGSHANSTPAAMGMSAPTAAAVALPPAALPTLPTPTAATVAAEPAAAPIATPRPVAKPRPVKVASTTRSYEEPVPLRHGSALPPANPAAQRYETYEPNPYGNAGSGYGNTGSGYGNAGSGYGNAQGSGYGSAPVQVSQAPVVQAPVARPVCANCGVVEAVIESTRPGDASGVGIAGGALGGAVIGKQFGSGRGRDFLTVLGAVGGAIAGNQVEKSVRSTKAYEVRVRMEDGSLRNLNMTTAPTWRSGDHVKVDGGSITLNQS